MDRTSKIAKVAAWLILVFVVVIIVGTVIGIFYTNEEYRAALSELYKVLNVVASILAVVSVFLGAYSIQQANKGSKQVNEVISNVEKVSATLDQATETLNGVSTSLGQAISKLDGISTSLAQSVGKLDGKLDGVLISQGLESKTLNETAVWIKALYDLQIQGIELRQLRTASPTEAVQQSDTGSVAPPAKVFGTEKDPSI